jgi:hypothetical protein
MRAREFEMILGIGTAHKRDIGSGQAEHPGLNVRRFRISKLQAKFQSLMALERLSSRNTRPRIKAP